MTRDRERDYRWITKTVRRFVRTFSVDRLPVRALVLAGIIAGIFAIVVAIVLVVLDFPCILIMVISRPNSRRARKRARSRDRTSVRSAKEDADANSSGDGASGEPADAMPGDRHGVSRSDGGFEDHDPRQITRRLRPSASGSRLLIKGARGEQRFRARSRTLSADLFNGR